MENEMLEQRKVPAFVIETRDGGVGAVFEDDGGGFRFYAYDDRYRPLELEPFASVGAAQSAARRWRETNFTQVA